MDTGHENLSCEKQNKLKVHCPEKYGIYAKKVEDNIPILQSKMLISRVGEKRTQATCKITGAGQGAKEGLAPVKPAVANGPESTEPEVPDADDSVEASTGVMKPTPSPDNNRSKACSNT